MAREEPAVMNKQDSVTVKLLTTYVYDHRAQLLSTLVKEISWKISLEQFITNQIAQTKDFMLSP